MKNKDLNTTQSQLTNYPVPDIPVGEAWNEMNQLLDANMPVPGDSKGGRKRYLLLLLLLLVTGSSIYFYYGAGKKSTISSSNTTVNGLNNDLKNTVNKTTADGSINKEDISDNNKETDKSNTLSANPDNTTRSSAPTGNITDKEAVAITKEKQQKPAASSAVAAIKMKNTVSGKINSGTTNITAALAESNSQISRKRTTGTGNNRVNPITTNEEQKKQNAKAAVSFNDEQAKAENKPVLNLSFQLPGNPSNTNATGIIENNAENPVTAQVKEAGNSPVINHTANHLTEVSNTTDEQAASTISAQKETKQTTQLKKTSKAIKQLGINYGLQWNVGIPVYGFKNYFTGTSGSSQPYVVVIPDVWIAKQMGGKQEVLFTLHLSSLYNTGEKQLTSSKGHLSIVDSTTVTKSLALLKTSGFAASLQYNYHLNRKWSVGAGVNYNMLNRALIKEKTTGVYTGTVISEATVVAERNGSNWIYLNSSFFTAKGEISYYLGKIKLGAAVFIPLSDLSSVPGNKIRPVNGQLFLRWNLKKK